MDEISSVPVDGLWRPAESPAHSQQDPQGRRQQDRRPAPAARDDVEEPHGLDQHAQGFDVAELSSALQSSLAEAIEALSNGEGERFLECVVEQQRLCELWRKGLNCAHPPGWPDVRTLAGVHALWNSAKFYHAVIERAEASNRALRGALGIQCDHAPGEF